MASQDKVQGVLESVLEDSLPLIHKGVFTPEQLQASMCERQKLENNMMRPAFKLSDYLKAIQYEYSLERSRRSRIEKLGSTNPLFRKQSKTDFIIIKRIIKLWDRTMHKFKYDLDLWKQYLQFCITAQSKKQFYKALSWGLRFLPYCQQLWLIGVYYEVEIGHNLWKARKIFIKSLKMNSKRPKLWLQMFIFEIKFLQILVQREQAIQGKQQFNFITSKQEHEQANGNHDQLSENQQKDGDHKMQQEQPNKQLNFQKFDQILTMVYTEAMTKMEDVHKQQFKNNVLEILSNKIKQYSSKNKTIKNVLNNALKSIQQFNKKNDLSQVKKQGNVRAKISALNTSNFQEKQKYYEHCLTQNSNLTVSQLDKIVSQFVTKPQYLSSLICHFLSINPQNCLQYIKKTKILKPENLPSTALTHIINYLTNESQVQNQDTATSLAVLKSLLSKIHPSKYIENSMLMYTVIKANKTMKNFKANNDIYRSVSVLCKKQPEVVERCLNYIQKNE